MIGFIAQAEMTDVTVDLTELQDGRWFSRDELRHPDGFSLPKEDSIARRIIEDWVG